MSKLAGKSHVGCNSHKVNLEVNHLIKSTADLNMAVFDVETVMKEATCKLKHSGLLRKFMGLKPVLANRTRWYGVCDIINLFVRLGDDLVPFDNKENGDISIYRIKKIQRKEQRYASMLGQINVVSISVQQGGRRLAKCRGDLDLVLYTLHEMKHCRNSVFCNCQLYGKCIAENLSVVLRKDFEIGVIKNSKWDDKLPE